MSMASIFDNTSNQLATAGPTDGSSNPTGNSNPFGNPTGNSFGRTGGTPANPYGVSSTGFSNPFGASSTGFSNPFTNPFAANGSNTESGFNTPGSGLVNLGMVPNAPLSQYQISPQVEAMLNGQGGFSPETMASMNATATESAANSGQQEMGAVKRAMAQQGISGSPAAAGYEGAVAKQTGTQEQQNLQQVQQEQAQAQLNQANMAAQIQAQAGEGNMNAANTLALSNAQMLYNALLANQNAVLTTQKTMSGLS